MALSELMFRVYRGIRTDIDAEVDGIFDPGDQAAENTAAKDVLHDLANNVVAKSSDDGLRDAHAVLANL